MTHPILNDLYKYLENEYVENSLLIDFNRIYWDRWGISRPQGQKSLKNFTIKIPDTNINTGKSKDIKIDYYFDKYLVESIRKAFDKLNQLYYHEFILIDTEVKKSTFYAQICRELDDLNSKVKQTEHLNTFKKEFTNGVSHFKRHNQISTVQKNTRKKHIKNGFLFREEYVNNNDINYVPNKFRINILKLRDFGYIDMDVSLDKILIIFNNNIIKEKIEWKSCLSSFCYFIKKLNNSKYIADYDPYHWGIADKCFNVRDRFGNPHSPKKFRLQKPPTQKKIDQIDQIFEEL